MLSPCTLPYWVPESVAADVVKFYKTQLRAALVELMVSSKAVRNQTKSIQSSRLSLDSLEERVFNASHLGYYNG